MDLSVLNHALNLKTGLTKGEQIADISDGAEKVLSIELDKIKTDPNQPRKSFDANDIQALADDIRSHGLIQPIIVRTDGIGQYIVVAGERRLRAFQLLKEPKIKAIVRNDYKSEQLGYIQMAENIKRADLKFYEMAEFIVSKIDAGVKQSTLADELGMSKSRISEYMSWADAPDYIKEARDSLGSVRAFYDLLSLSKEYEEAVKEFLELNAGERISISAVNELKRKLKEPDQEIESEVSADSQAEDSGPGDLLAGEDHDLSDNSDSSTESDEYEWAVSDSGQSGSDVESDSGEGPEDSHGVSDSTETMDLSETESAGNDETDVYKESQSGESVYASTDSDEAAIYEDQESMEPDTGDKSSDENKLKRPLIVGSVEGREGYLQFKRRPSTDGFLWIKWDDGFEEEVLAEDFRINRIIEE